MALMHPKSTLGQQKEQGVNADLAHI